MPAYFEAGVFADNKPFWHGLGIVRPEKVLTAAQIMESEPILASEVIKVPVWASVPVLDPITGTQKSDDKGNPLVDQVSLPGKVMTVRAYDRRPLGIVGKKYSVLNNTDAFDFLDTLVDSGEAMYDTAGTLYDGRVVWLLARLPQAIKIAGMDSELANRYLLLKNSHDGSSAVELMITTVRVGCANTLAFAKAKANYTFKVRHTKNMDGKIAEARKALAMTFEYDAALDDLANRMLDDKVSDSRWHEIVETLVPTKDADGKRKEGRGLTVAAKTQVELHDIYFHASNLDDVRGTAWGALNAVVQYFDHNITGRETETATTDESRFMRITSRPAGNIVARAENLLIPA